MSENQFGGAGPRLTEVPADGIPITRVAPAGAGAASGNSAFGTSASGGSGAEQPSLADLFKSLTADAGALVREEVNLLRAELKQAGSTLAKDGQKVGIAVGLALLGAFALTAALIVFLGDLLGGHYGLSALIVGAVFLGVGAFLATSAINDVKRRGIMPQQTLASLKEDVAWGKQESREVKRELTK